MDELSLRFRSAYERLLRDQPAPPDFDALTEPVVSGPRPQPSGWPQIAAAAALMVALVTAVVWVAQRQPVPLAELSAPARLKLAAGDALWPPFDMAGTPVSVATAFAEEVLGWGDAAATEGVTGNCGAAPPGREACWPSSVAVTLSQPDIDPLDMVMLPIGGDEPGRLWAVMQVGAGYPVHQLQTGPAGTLRIPDRIGRRSGFR